MTKTPLEKILFIIITLLLLYFTTNCASRKKIDYKNNPHYPYVIEKIKK